MSNIYKGTPNYYHKLWEFYLGQGSVVRVKDSRSKELVHIFKIKIGYHFIPIAFGSHRRYLTP